MLDWVILHAITHYLPPEALAALSLLLAAWVVFENWLARTGRIKANCTLDLFTKNWLAPLAAGLKGLVGKNGGIMAGVDRPALSGGTREPAPAGAGQSGPGPGQKDAGGVGPGEVQSNASNPGD